MVSDGGMAEEAAAGHGAAATTTAEVIHPDTDFF